MLQRVVWRLMFAAFALVGSAQACSCIAVDVPEAVNKADVVFRGKVMDIHDAKRDVITDVLQSPKRIVVIRVSRVWKGAVGEQFEMTMTARDDAPCTLWQRKVFVVGNEVLVFARRSDATGEFTTSLCSHTGLTKESTKDIQELGAGKLPNARPEERAVGAHER